MARSPMHHHLIQQTEGCPILLLSVELLRLVMELYVVDFPEVALPVATHPTSSSVHALTRVCSFWRDVATGHPRLWTHIEIRLSSSSPIRKDILSTFLQRSTHLPLTIAITVPPLYTTLDAGLQEIQEVFRMLPVQSRLRALRMTLTTALLRLLNKRFASSSSHDAAGLSHEVEEVHIAVIPQAFDIYPALNLNSFLTWPNSTYLRRLTVVPADLSSKHLASSIRLGMDTSQLTHLNLCGTKETPDGALMLLQRSPALITFIIDLRLDLTSEFHLNLGGQGIMVDHPVIQDLHVTVRSEMTPGVTLATFLQHLSTTNLSRIKIGHGSNHCVNMLHSDSVAFLRRSPELKTVYLCWMDEKDIKEVLGSCSSLQELDVVTELREKSPPPLPKWYTDLAPIDIRIDALESMIMDRRAYFWPHEAKKDDISRLFSRLKKACPPRSPPRQLHITIGGRSKTFSH